MKPRRRTLLLVRSATGRVVTGSTFTSGGDETFRTFAAPNTYDEGGSTGVSTPTRWFLVEISIFLARVADSPRVLTNWRCVNVVFAIFCVTPSRKHVLLLSSRHVTSAVPSRRVSGGGARGQQAATATPASSSASSPRPNYQEPMIRQRQIIVSNNQKHPNPQPKPPQTYKYHPPHP